ncbi:DUF222 domain-containing protein [Ammonicoccus fulvus]|uniref:DUF222 domain-containing protein n=1 Tax=Ammonicoccus fulvus TaxID=3138240 RepID=A0ABZ3FN04_9ACTN
MIDLSEVETFDVPEPPPWLLEQWREHDAWFDAQGNPEPQDSAEEEEDAGQWEPGDLGWEPCELDDSEIVAWMHRLGTALLPGTEGALIDLIRGLEDLKSCAAAVQARAAVAFDATRRQAEADRGIAVSRRGIGVGAEVALARRESPFRGGRLLGLAKNLVNELPCTLAALESGALSEWRATLIASETACLSIEDRGIVDRWFIAYLQDHPSIGDTRLEAEIRRKVTETDQTAVVRRRSKAAGGRRVTTRPLPDDMVEVTAVLKLQEGVALYATLLKAAEAAIAQGDTRGKGVIMADLLVERITARPAEAPCDIELMVVISDEALFSETEEPAHVDGYGPVPAAWVRDLIAEADDAEQRIMVRRLFRHPDRTTRMETHRRQMSPAMRKLIRIRDHRCRMPWCNARIRHTDHVIDHSNGGDTSVPNGQGLCAACNYTKQAEGWTCTPSQDPDLGHIVTITTPTGHQYRSTQPSGPGD